MNQIQVPKKLDMQKLDFRYGDPESDPNPDQRTCQDKISTMVIQIQIPDPDPDPDPGPYPGPYPDPDPRSKSRFQIQT